MSLVIVGLTSLVGAILNFRRGNVAVKPVVFLATTGIVGSFLGSTGTHLVARRTLMLLFASLMIVVGFAMWQGSARFRRSQTCRASHCLLAGFFVGLLTGFLGIGGGFLIVPALVLFGGLDTKLAAGSSLAVIAVNAVIGLVGQLRFQPLEWTSVGGFLLFAIAGMVIGNRVSQRLPEFHVRRIFAITVMIVGASIGLENLLS